MSLIKIHPEFFETFTLRLHPQREFTSSSIHVSGAISLVARPSENKKDLFDPSVVGDFSPAWSRLQRSNEADLQSAIDIFNADYKGSNSGVNIERQMLSYISGVHALPQATKNTRSLEITRFEPPFKIDINTTSKNIVRKILMPHYAYKYTNCNFSYTNYQQVHR